MEEENALLFWSLLLKARRVLPASWEWSRASYLKMKLAAWRSRFMYIYKSCHDDILFIPLFPFPLLGKSRSSQQAAWREREQESPFKNKLQMQVTLVEAPRGGRFPSTGAGTSGLASPDRACCFPPRMPPPGSGRGQVGWLRHQGYAADLCELRMWPHFSNWS